MGQPGRHKGESARPACDKAAGKDLEAVTDPIDSPVRERKRRGGKSFLKTFW